MSWQRSPKLRRDDPDDAAPYRLDVRWIAIQKLPVTLQHRGVGGTPDGCRLVLIGGAGAGIMNGGNGDDVLLGGPGLDNLDGGLGSNVVIQK